MNIENFFETIFSAYNLDPKWYPFILIAIGILVLIIVFVIFSYIRNFIAWILGVSEVSRLQKQNNELLQELLALQRENNDLLYAMYEKQYPSEEYEDLDDWENLDENDEEIFTENTKKFDNSSK